MAYWVCAQLVPGQERLALHCLEQVAGFEVYAPRIRAPTDARRQDPRPLFPSYVFILIVLQWHAARGTPCVVRLVLDGGVPARVPDNVITGLRQRERYGLVQLPCRRPRARHARPAGRAGGSGRRRAAEPES